MSLAEEALRCASVRTASATTAKPLPCSPARAASTAALSANRFVWNAISSITEMISSIFFEDLEISVIEPINVWISRSPTSAASRDETDREAACLALSEFI
ncbi:hypothetical protein D3C87_1449060 [compost metagenome]